MPTTRTPKQSHPVDDLKSFHANGGKRYSSLNPAEVAPYPFEIDVSMGK